MDVDGSNVRQLTDNQEQDAHASWSPDGTKIVFESTMDDENGEIYIMNADGSNVVRVTNNDAYDSQPAWAPRKQGIAVDEAGLFLTPSSIDPDMTVSALSAAVRPAVVRIETDLGSGSGFIYDATGLVVTNNHVITGAETITVTLDDGTDITGTVVGRDQIRDLAILQLEGEDLNLPTINVASQGALELGQEVVVVGYALGAEDVSITQGVVSSLPYDQGRNIDWVQTDAAINPGNSGGPMFNRQGEVVGIVTAKFVDVSIEGVGFAIGAETFWTYLNTLLEQSEE